MNDQILIGDTVEDTITGLKGVVIARTEWLHGCVRMVIQPRELKDGKPVDTACVDEPQLKIITEGPRHAKPISKHPGGPNPSTPRTTTTKI